MVSTVQNKIHEKAHLRAKWYGQTACGLTIQTDPLTAQTELESEMLCLSCRRLASRHGLDSQGRVDKA